MKDLWHKTINIYENHQVIYQYSESSTKIVYNVSSTVTPRGFRVKILDGKEHYFQITFTDYNSFVESWQSYPPISHICPSLQLFNELIRIL